MGSSASLGGASLSLVAAAALCGCARRGGTFATAAHYGVTNRNTRRLLRGRHIRKLQSDFDPAYDFPPLNVPTDQTTPMEQMEPNFDPTAGIPGMIPGMPGIPNTDTLEPPVDPADLQFDPDDTTGIPGMDMLPPGSEGSEQSPIDPSSSEIKYVPSEEELEMQEIPEAMMPEGWDPNNPKASLDALIDQNTEETELGASMSEEEEEAYQGDPLMLDDPMFDDPMYDPNSPDFDEEALGELDEESLAILAEKYGDEIMEYGDEGGLGEDQLDPANDQALDTFNFNDPKYDHNSAFYDPEAVNELSDADKALIEKMYGKITYEKPAYEDEITLEDQMDPAYDPTLDTVTSIPPAVGFPDEYQQTPPPGDGEDPAEEPFDELEDPGEDLDEEQMEQYEDTADMATASPPPLGDMPTGATGMPPDAEIGQEPNLDPALTPAPFGEGEDEMNLYPEDEPGPDEDVEEKWGLENEWPLRPTDKPTPRPTALYVPFDYDESPEDGTAVEAGDAGDEVFYHGLEPQIGPVGKYFDGVGSPEEIEEDKNVQVVGGVLLALFLVLVLVTAHSVMNNPDGLCAGCCRLTLQIICCFTRVLCLPCRALCCRDEQGRGRRTHAPMRTPFPSDLELS